MKTRTIRRQQACHPFSGLLLLLGAAAIVACGETLPEPEDDPLLGGGLGPIDPTATFTRVQDEVLTPTCAQIGCHNALGQQAQLTLGPGRAYANIVNVPSTQMASLRLVLPGSPANSYLFRKITGSGIAGDRMPPSLAPLSDAQIALVRDWIRRAAPND